MISVKELSEKINTIAPYSLAIEGDNCGIILNLGNETDRVLFALDTTPETITEAAEKGCGVVISHHPAAFYLKRNFSIDDAAIFAAQRGISLIAAHTCYDAAPGGVNDVLCGLIGITGTERFGDIGRGGSITPTSCADFIAHVKGVLGCDSVKVVPAVREIKRVAVIGGSVGDGVGEAIAGGYDALVTGEARHNDGITARSAGLCLVAAGHFSTENPSIDPLCGAMQKLIGDAAQCILSQVCADPYVLF